MYGGGISRRCSAAGLVLWPASFELVEAGLDDGEIGFDLEVERAEGGAVTADASFHG